MTTTQTATLERRLEQAADRFEELERLLAQPDATREPGRFAALSREYAELGAIVSAWRARQEVERRAGQARTMLKEADAELRAMAAEEISACERERAVLDKRLKRLILPADPNDERNIYLEIRAGTGGEEAALFTADLLRMYSRYAERQGWTIEVMSAHPSGAGGYREVIARVVGRGAWSKLKFESGVHRVQRVPATESQGRIHTSACTVAILPEVAEIETVELDPADLRIDTFRSSGAGGQHVNTTDSAIRVTHLPSGIVVECQDERSQHKNRARAMNLLKARLLDAERAAQRESRAQARRVQVGTGDRSERIRTYNFPQGRITDHRINLTLHELENVLEGGLDPVIAALSEADQAERLSELG